MSVTPLRSLHESFSTKVHKEFRPQRSSLYKGGSPSHKVFCMMVGQPKVLDWPTVSAAINPTGTGDISAFGFILHLSICRHHLYICTIDHNHDSTCITYHLLSSRRENSSSRHEAEYRRLRTCLVFKHTVELDVQRQRPDSTGASSRYPLLCPPLCGLLCTH